MTHCKVPTCKLAPWRRGWCYTHWRQSLGFVFDPEQRVFVKRRKAVVADRKKQWRAATLGASA